MKSQCVHSNESYLAILSVTQFIMLQTEEVLTFRSVDEILEQNGGSNF